MDGRFEKLFIFTQSRVSPAKMAQIAEKLFNTFSEEFEEFKVEFDEFVENRWNPNYESRGSFQEYNFYKNEILENICEERP